MRTSFTSDTHAEEMLKPGDPLYDRIQRIRDHLAADRPQPRPEWIDALDSYKPADPMSWPRGGPHNNYAFYPMDQSGSMPASSYAMKASEFRNAHCGDMSEEDFRAALDATWAGASPEMRAASRAAAEAIIEGHFTFVSETDA